MIRGTSKRTSRGIFAQSFPGNSNSNGVHGLLSIGETHEFVGIVILVGLNGIRGIEGRCSW